jgi:TRAP-type C4-dicarboxylate transport system permease large subunit
MEMQTNLFIMLVIIGAVLSLMAAAMAYLISYAEYEKHFVDKWKPKVMALEAAAVIFLLFMVITLVAAFYFGGSSFVANPSG